MIQQMDVLPIQQKNQNFVLEKKELPSANDHTPLKFTGEIIKTC